MFDYGSADAVTELFFAALEAGLRDRTGIATRNQVRTPSSAAPRRSTTPTGAPRTSAPAHTPTGTKEHPISNPLPQSTLFFNPSPTLLFMHISLVIATMNDANKYQDRLVTALQAGLEGISLGCRAVHRSNVEQKHCGIGIRVHTIRIHTGETRSGLVKPAAAEQAVGTAMSTHLAAAVGAVIGNGPGRPPLPPPDFPIRQATPGSS